MWSGGGANGVKLQALEQSLEPAFAALPLPPIHQQQHQQQQPSFAPPPSFAFPPPPQAFPPIEPSPQHQIAAPPEATALTNHGDFAAATVSPASAPLGEPLAFYPPPAHDSCAHDPTEPSRHALAVEAVPPVRPMQPETATSMAAFLADDCNEDRANVLAQDDVCAPVLQQRAPVRPFGVQPLQPQRQDTLAPAKGTKLVRRDAFTVDTVTNGGEENNGSGDGECDPPQSRQSDRENATVRGQNQTVARILRSPYLLAVLTALLVMLVLSVLAPPFVLKRRHHANTDGTGGGAPGGVPMDATCRWSLPRRQVDPARVILWGALSGVAALVVPIAIDRIWTTSTAQREVRRTSTRSVQIVEAASVSARAPASRGAPQGWPARSPRAPPGGLWKRLNGGPRANQ